MIDYRQPPLGYLVRVPQENLDSPLDESARTRAEEAARFLSFQYIHSVFASELPAPSETAQIILHNCCPGQEFVQGLSTMEDPDVICGCLRNIGSTVLVLTDQEIRAAIERLTANVCGQIVAPGGIVSVHRHEDKTVAVARTMILDFAFTDFVEAVNAGPQ